jgi:hypothetical protein
MNRRNVLKILGCVPFVGWFKRKDIYDILDVPYSFRSMEIARYEFYNDVVIPRMKDIIKMKAGGCDVFRAYDISGIEEKMKHEKKKRS